MPAHYERRPIFAAESRAGRGTSLRCMSVLVTGGAGYIGSHTVRRLHADGVDVVVLDTLELGYPQSIPGIPLVQASIDDVEAVTAICKEHGVRQVVHFAGYKSVGESMEQPTKYWINNVAGTATLVDTLLGVGVDQIVFSSSCSVNGTPDVVPVAEDAPLRPESVYAASKATVEQMLGWYGVTSGLRAVSLRYFNAAGASDDGRFGEVWDRSRCSVTTIPRRTARASATTSTSTTSPMRTSGRSPTSPEAARRSPSTSAPAWAARCSR